MERLFLLTDYRGQFYSSTRVRGGSVEIKRLSEYFLKHQINLIVVPFADVDFRSQNYSGYWVLYQSSEDPGLHYRSYIEDIILGLQLQGAKLIPNLFHFRAHHNKHFLEILRSLHTHPEIKNLSSKGYGTLEDYYRSLNLNTKDPVVLKSSHSSKSRGVHLLENILERKFLPRLISHTLSMQNLWYMYERLTLKSRPLKISNYRSKFITQSFVSGLSGDFRIVIYGKKYYVLYRKNRLSDFRASGSKRFTFDFIMPRGLLDYAEAVFHSFDVPYMAMDVGVKESNFYLFEFQFLCFGQYAFEKSSYYYYKYKNQWLREYEIPDLEKEIADSVHEYIAHKNHIKPKMISRE